MDTIPVPQKGSYKSKAYLEKLEKGTVKNSNKQNTRENKNSKLIKSAEQVSQYVKHDSTLMSKSDPGFLAVKENVVPPNVDDLGFKGELDNDAQIKYNATRDKLLCIVGQIPEVRNFNFNRVMTMPLFALTNFVTLCLTPTLLPTNFDVLNTKFFDFNRLLAPVGGMMKVVTSLGAAAKQADWLEKQFVEVQTWKAIESLPDVDYDVRQDALRNSPLNHIDTRLIKYSVSTQLLPNSYFANLILDTNKKIYRTFPVLKKWIKIITKKTLSDKVVSNQLISQALQGHVAPLSMPFKDCELRIHKAVQSNPNVNINKDAEINGDPIVHNSCKLATVIHGRTREETIKPKTTKRLERNILRGYRTGEVPLAKIDHLKLGPDCYMSKPAIIPKFYRPVIAASLIINTPYHCPQPDPEDPHTVMAGLMKRVCSKNPKYNIDRLNALREFAKKHMRSKFKPISIAEDTSFETWLSKTNYSEDRKNQLRMKNENVTDIHRDSFKKVPSFVKDESYDGYKYPRGIYSRSDEFKCIVGPYFKLMESIVYELPEFIKHVPVAERAKYVEDHVYADGARYAMTDYTSMESSFLEEVMQIEFDLYEYLLSELMEGPEIMKLIRETMGGVNCIMFKYITLFLKARRMSGEMCTSLGNGWTNYIVLKFLFYEAGEEAHFVVEGDDGLTRIVNFEPTTEQYAEFGFTVKIEFVDDVSLGSFCGMIYDKTDRITITNPMNVIADFFWVGRTYACSKERIHLELLRAKSLSLLYTYPGCPILHSMAKWLVRMTKDYVPNWNILGWYMKDQLLRDMKFYQKHDTVLNKPIGTNTRELMFAKYKIPIDDQIAIESYFDNKNDLKDLQCNLIDLHMPAMFKKFYDDYSEKINVLDDRELLDCTKEFKIVDRDSLNIILPEKNTIEYGVKNKDPIALRGMQILYDKHVDFQFNNKNKIENLGIFEDEEICESSDSSIIIDDIENIIPDSDKIEMSHWKFDSNDDWEFKVVEKLKPTFMQAILNEVTEFTNNLFRMCPSMFDDSSDFEIIDNKFTYKVLPIMRKEISYNPECIGDILKFLKVNLDWLKTKTANFNSLVRIGALKLLISMTNSNYGNTNGLRYITGQYRNENNNRGCFLSLNTLFYNLNMKRNNRNNINKTMKAKTQRRANMNAQRKKNRKNTKLNSRLSVIRRNAPNAISTQLRTKNAQFFRSNDGSVRIQHREPLGIQLGHTAFTNNQFLVNPGLASTFPWLSKTAQNFEAYRFNKLNVEFVTSVGSNIGGSICIAPDYNSADTSPVNLQQLEQYQDAWRDVVWEDGVCIIRPSGMGVLGPKRYIRATTLNSNLDIKTYDVCSINVATSGVVSDASQIGELWVNYDVTLSIPNSFISDVLSTDTAQYFNSNGAGILITNLFGTAISTGAFTISNALNVLTITGLQLNTKYHVDMFITNTGTSTTALGTAASSGTSAFSNYITTLVTGVGFQISSQFISNASTVTITYNGPTVIGTPTSMLVSVYPVNPGAE